jgi:hypothetical protein
MCPTGTGKIPKDGVREPWCRHSTTKGYSRLPPACLPDNGLGRFCKNGGEFLLKCRQVLLNNRLFQLGQSFGIQSGGEQPF